HDGAVEPHVNAGYRRNVKIAQVGKRSLVANLVRQNLQQSIERQRSDIVVRGRLAATVQPDAGDLIAIESKFRHSLTCVRITLVAFNLLTARGIKVFKRNGRYAHTEPSAV